MTDETSRVLLVEDEEDIAFILRFLLERNGFQVDHAPDGREAMARLDRDPPDIVILDIMLPYHDGLEIVEALRNRPSWQAVPVLMLTAKAREADIVRALELGADDYVTKPFSPKVLLARINAVLRRSELSGGKGAVEVGGVRMDPERHEVIADGKQVDLTATEFNLLRLLMSRPGRVYTRQQIIESIHDGFAAVTDRSVDVQVVSLRRKLGEAGERVQTVRGVGYRFGE